ncbi:MAG: hypothetical protein SGILL_001660 [Bacillariaceae sp.]
MMKEQSEERQCIQCAKALPRAQYSKSQWKKGPGNGRCSTCVGGEGNGNVAAATKKKSFLSKAQQQSKPKPKPQQASPGPSPTMAASPKPGTALSHFLARPQIAVPGFENLTVCSDWPQTIRGEPPAAQSAIFMPLLACVIGSVEGYCTPAQLEIARQWWTFALPAWPRWIEALKKAGVAKSRLRLLKSARGQPNALIPKVKGNHGTIPHVWGKLQSEALEQDPVVAIEVYACVTLLYSKSAIGGKHNTK